MEGNVIAYSKYNNTIFTVFIVQNGYACTNLY